MKYDDVHVGDVIQAPDGRRFRVKARRAVESRSWEEGEQPPEPRRRRCLSGTWLDGDRPGVVYEAGLGDWRLVSEGRST